MNKKIFILTGIVTFLSMSLCACESQQKEQPVVESVEVEETKKMETTNNKPYCFIIDFLILKNELNWNLDINLYDNFTIKKFMNVFFH